MRALLPWIVLGAFAGALVAGTWAYQQRLGSESFFLDSVRTWSKPPWSQTKVLAVAAALVMVPALLLGVLEWRADLAFRRALHELRASDLAGDLVEYDGPEGAGVLFLSPTRRALLLRPVAGLGTPRVIELPGVPSAELRGSEEPV